MVAPLWYLPLYRAYSLELTLFRKARDVSSGSPIDYRSRHRACHFGTVDSSPVRWVWRIGEISHANVSASSRAPTRSHRPDEQTWSHDANIMCIAYECLKALEIACYPDGTRKLDAEKLAAAKKNILDGCARI